MVKSACNKGLIYIITSTGKVNSTWLHLVHLDLGSGDLYSEGWMTTIMIEAVPVQRSVTSRWLVLFC